MWLTCDFAHDLPTCQDFRTPVTVRLVFRLLCGFSPMSFMHTVLCLCSYQALSTLVTVSGGDMRKAMTMMESAHALCGADLMRPQDVMEVACVSTVHPTYLPPFLCLRIHHLPGLPVHPCLPRDLGGIRCLMQKRPCLPVTRFSCCAKLSF